MLHKMARNNFILFSLFLFVMVSTMGLAQGDQLKKETENEQILRVSRNALNDTKNYSPQELHEIILQNNSDYYVISLQSEEDYAKGHIPGAVRWSVDLANPAPALEYLPKDKHIIVTCDSGQESNKVAFFLQQLGYNASALMFGMTGWNQSFAGSRAYTGGNHYPITTEEAVFVPAEQMRSSVSSMEDGALILQRTAEYTSQGRATSISVDEVMNMGDNAIIISMQWPQDYAYGHIAGAVNLPAGLFLSGSEELLSLPRDKKIIVTCYIGHYSNIGALLLNQLGYEAYSLEWGLAGWNADGLKNAPSLLEASLNLPIEN